jgi:FkbM family methyltransferase
VRTHLKTLARCTGVTAPMRSVLERTHPAYRRDARDNEHLRLLLAFSLDVDSCCVDIGANHGEVLAQIAHLAPEGHHFAFEPLPALAEDVARRFPTASVHQVALSDRDGRAPFSYVTDDDGYSGLSDRGLGSQHKIEHIEVPLARLDDVLPDDYAPRFLKIDVEGHELQVLRGAMSTLTHHRPLLWFEHGHVSSGYFGATPYDVWDLLDEIGYRIFNADGEGPLDRATFFSGTGRPMWNYVAR